MLAFLDVGKVKTNDENEVIEVSVMQPASQTFSRERPHGLSPD